MNVLFIVMMASVFNFAFPMSIPKPTPLGIDTPMNAGRVRVRRGFVQSRPKCGSPETIEMVKEIFHDNKTKRIIT